MSNTSSTGIMCDLPLGIWRDVLLRLPAESLLRLRSISKGWRAMIDDPSFVEAHTQKQQASSNTTLLIKNSTGPPFHPLYLVDLQALSFTNGSQTIRATPLKLTHTCLSSLPPLPAVSCNGLMLIFPLHSFENQRYRMMNMEWVDLGTLEIWNPLTHERLKLPQPNIKGKVSGHGFGYDSVSNDYNVVLTDYIDNFLSNSESEIRTHVYSLRSNSWRMIEDCPCKILTREGVFLNGALHWVTYFPEGLIIVVIDVGTESYRWSRMNLPTDVLRMRTIGLQLAALGGCLFLSYHLDKSYEDIREVFEGWVMDCYGAESSWVKLFSVNSWMYSRNSDLKPVAYVKDNKRVLVQHKHGFLWIDVDSNSVKRVGVHGFCEDSSAQVFVGSLFRLRERHGSVGDKRKMRQRKWIAHTRLTFCVRDYDVHDHYVGVCHDSCYSSDSN